MANRADVSIEGSDELLAAFAAMGDAVRADTLGQAALAGGLPILNAAKDNAPKRTRTLARSLHEELVQASPAYAEVEIGTDLEYARIQEYGGVITAKNGKYLAIPLTDTARAASSPLFFPLVLHFVPSARGGVLLDRTGEAHYALVSSVTIPAYPYLRPALDEKQGEAADAAGAALAAIIEKAAA